MMYKPGGLIGAMKNFIIRGILIGASLGVFGALAGFSDSMPRAFGVGMIAGALAGLTLGLRRRKRQGDASGSPEGR